MKKTSLQKNSVYILASFFTDFFISLFQSLSLFFRMLLWKHPHALRENSFLDSVNFILHIGPKSFWKSPSGIKIGRSISTFLHYVFEKDAVFKEKQNRQSQ